MFLKKKKKKLYKKNEPNNFREKNLQGCVKPWTWNGVSQRFLIGLIGFCIIVNTMNIWMDIYGVVPHLALKLGKLLRHMTQNWTSIVESNERKMCSSLYFIAINRY